MSEVRAWLAALTIHVGQMLGGWIFGASAVIWGLLERAFLFEAQIKKHSPTLVANIELLWMRIAGCAATMVSYQRGVTRLPSSQAVL